MSSIRFLVLGAMLTVLHTSSSSTAQAQDAILFPKARLDSIRNAWGRDSGVLGIGTSPNSNRLQQRASQLVRPPRNYRVLPVDSLGTLAPRAFECPMPVARVDSSRTYAARIPAPDSTMTTASGYGVLHGCTNPLQR